MKKILFISSNRADFSLIKPFYQILKNESNLDVKFLVTGSHLSSKLGHSINEIISDNIQIDYLIHIFSNIPRTQSTSKLLAITIRKFCDFFELNKFDYVSILGDRFETLGIALAAFNNKIPIIHFYGGELTYGALDDTYRHLLSKLSHFHFTSTEIHRKRVIQLGENPNNVFNIGAIGIENIKKENRHTITEINKILELKLESKKYGIVTFHPETSTLSDPISQIKIILSICKVFSSLSFIFTKSNVDEGGILINNYLENNIKFYSNCFLFDSLGSKMYHSLVENALFVMGNSSSGLIEVPSFNIPTINLGERQNGRPKSLSIIDLEIDYNSIYKVINDLINKKYTFNNNINPYGDGNTTDKFLYIFKKITKNDDKNYIKKFFDLNYFENI